MIRFWIGLVLVMGGVGHIDVNPQDQALIEGVAVSILGLILMHFGARHIESRYGD